MNPEKSSRRGKSDPMARCSYAHFRRWLNTPDGRLLIKCLLSVFVFGIAAHAYAFLNPLFSHDSMTALVADAAETRHKITLGRFLVPLYRGMTHGSFSQPWLIGLFALMWISLSVWLTARMLRLNGMPAIALCAGLFTANVTVTAMTATYIYELDADMFALLTAVLAAYCWHGNSKKGLIAGMLLTAATLALYQSYISVTITLIIILCILDILNCRRTSGEILVRGLKGVLMLAVGAAGYLVLIKSVTVISGVSLSTDKYNSLTNMSHLLESPLPGQLVGMYVHFAETFCDYALQYSGYPRILMLAVHVLLLVVALPACLRILISRRIKVVGKLMLAGLVILLPAAMNFSHFLLGGSHSLMHYAFIFVYLLILLVVLHDADLRKAEKPACSAMSVRCTCALIALILLGNIQASNAMYLQKDLEQQTTLSAMTRIADHMEEQDDYIAGVTPVFIIRRGAFRDPASGFNRYEEITGMAAGAQVTYEDTFVNYFEYVLKEPLLVPDQQTKLALLENEEVLSMPAYPESGYILMQDGVLVVRVN